MPDSLCHCTRAVLAAVVGLGLLLLALPALASAATVSVRIEATGGPLVPNAVVTLPTAPVPAAGAAVAQTCPGDTVIGALDAATSGDWSGTWSAPGGWSIERIKTLDIPAGSGRHWGVYLDDQYLNDAPCGRELAQDDVLIFYPQCGASSSQCFTNGPLTISAASSTGPGGRLSVQVWETNTTFSPLGIGTSQRTASTGAAVYGPDNSTTTDQYYGFALLTFSDRGPHPISVAKAGHIPDRASVCVTDGADGFCGTSVAETNPFDPLAFCQSTGDDGLCNTVDKRPPIGYIREPVQAKKYPAKSKPRFLRGTVDSDPSQVEEVRLRLVRKSRIPGTKLVTRMVTVKKRVNGKIVRKKVRKKVRVKVRRTTCFTWNTSKSSWTKLKSCKAVPDQWFKAEGADVWSYEFLEVLPGGVYTLDARAVDGAGNVDSAQEVGRNRITFTAG